MVTRIFLSGYKSHDRHETDDMLIKMMYVLTHKTESWDGKTVDDRGYKTYLSEGEVLDYTVRDKDFIFDIDVERYDMLEFFLSTDDIIFLDSIRNQEKIEWESEKQKRRYYNQMEIDHD